MHQTSKHVLHFTAYPYQKASQLIGEFNTHISTITIAGSKTASYRILAFLLLETRWEGEWVGVSMLAEAGNETVMAGV